MQIRPDSDFITAVIALRQPKTRSKTDFSRDIFTHITITILAQRGIEGVSLGMLSDTSNMGRHVRAIQRALEWNNADMQAVMEALGYTNIIHLDDGIDFKDETSQVRQDVERLLNNVVERPMQELERFAKKAFRW